MKACIVEESQCLDAKFLRQKGCFDSSISSGTIDWSFDGTVRLAVNYGMEIRGGAGYFRVRYVIEDRGREAVATDEIELVATSPNYGGARWWFRCSGCVQRARKLFLPPGAAAFRCRRCHGLTYRSCQESHTLWGDLHRLQRLGLFVPLGG